MTYYIQPTMTINPRQSTESRQAEIIATVVALAAERNPADVTTTDIAKAMNVTQGALFRHFPRVGRESCENLGKIT